jgi:hypothetical protein
MDEGWWERSPRAMSNQKPSMLCEVSWNCAIVAIAAAGMAVFLGCVARQPFDGTQMLAVLIYGVGTCVGGGLGAFTALIAAVTARSRAQLHAAICPLAANAFLVFGLPILLHLFAGGPTLHDHAASRSL